VREVELSATELRVLQLHAGLAPGYALSVSEVAQALRARRHDTRELLSALKELGLLNRTLGGTDDETSYTLSAAGKALLAARATRRASSPRPPKSQPSKSRAWPAAGAQRWRAAARRELLRRVPLRHDFEREHLPPGSRANRHSGISAALARSAALH
jgi:DNA-binding IclR family transcriptional regulator